MFLTLGGAFPNGAREQDLVRLYRPRPGLPFTTYQLADGSKRLVWTTFTAQQVDVDVRAPATQAYLRLVLDRIADAGVANVRLDAVGYAVKTPGSTSFMTPETFAFIDTLTEWCHDRGLEVLVEVHSYYRQQIEIARKVDRVYDFALPPLVLHALTAADADPLLSWLAVRPTNAVTVLDTHDGIGVIDVGADAQDRTQLGLLTPEQIDTLVETMHDNSGGTSRRATGAAASNVDLYQVNCTFYDALGRDDERYLLARALQFWTPGVPQVYYVGLLAGSNDMELLAATGVGRDVNRHHYTRAEIATELETSRRAGVGPADPLPERSPGLRRRIHRLRWRVADHRDLDGGQPGRRARRRRGDRVGDRHLDGCGRRSVDRPAVRTPLIATCHTKRALGRTKRRTGQRLQSANADGAGGGGLTDPGGAVCRAVCRAVPWRPHREPATRGRPDSSAPLIDDEQITSLRENPGLVLPELAPAPAPEATLTVHTDGCGVIRTEVPAGEHNGLTWNVYDPDGFLVLGRVADNETRYRYFQSGTYTVNLEALIGTEYVTISNTVTINC